MRLKLNPLTNSGVSVVEPVTVIAGSGGGSTTSSSGVSSIAKSGDTALTGAVTLSQGSNVLLTQVGQDIQIAATAGAATPAGSDTEIQFNDGGAFGSDPHLTYDKVNDVFHAHKIAGDATDGLILESANGTDIGLLGPANTANVTWYGSHNFDTATANTIAGFGASKTLGSLALSTYPSLTELAYVKGVTSAIQTQLDGKVDENAAIVGATKTKITYDTKGLVTSGADATTADIADSTNKRYVTDAQLTVIGNTSGTNTGDVTVSDSSEIDLTLTGQQISASIVAGSIDETKLDTSVNASLDLADSALQASAIGTTVQAYDADLTTLSTAFTSASASGPASLAFAEDTDNGTNVATITAPASMSADRIITLPNITGTLVARTSTDTLENKTLDLTSNTLTGTTAQFNTALSDNNFATLAGSETLTNKTINSTTNTVVPVLPYKFAAYSTSAQNSGNGAFAQTLFATEEYDTGGNYTSSTFTAPVAGFYRFTALVGSNATSSVWIVSLFKNGSEIKRGTDSRLSTGIVNGLVTATLQLAVNDTVDVRTFGNAAVAINVTQQTCYFQGEIVSL